MLYYNIGVMTRKEAPSTARKRRSSVLALLAVMLQLVIAATHHHNDDVGPGSSPRQILEVTDAGSPPSGKHPQPENSGDHDDCPICQGLQLAAASLLPDLVPIAVPLDFADIAAAEGPVAARRSPRIVLFRSRAPPAA